MASSLDGKVAIITGASSGIGAATAVLFARLGASLCLTGRNVEKLEEVVKKCVEASPMALKPLAIPGDVMDEQHNKHIVSETVSHFGRLNILVTSAGILKIGSLESTSMDDYDTVMNLNTRAVFCIQKFAVPHLINSKGNIVHVSSINGLRSFPGVLAYCMSKSAVDQLTRCTALELAPKQVRVNSVNPGVIKTEVHKRAGMNDETYEKFLQHSRTTHALGRHGEPDEVASAIAFLASDAASFITGVQLPVCGGRGVMCPR